MKAAQAHLSTLLEDLERVQESEDQLKLKEATRSEKLEELKKKMSTKEVKS